MNEQRGLKISTAGNLVYFVAGLFTLIFTIDRRWGAPVESLA